jgi:hypothetical protein
MRHSWTGISRLGNADVTQPAAGGEVRSPPKLSFLAGETDQAAHDPCSVGDFVLKGLFADLVKLDLQALERKLGFAVGTMRPWWRCFIRP